MKILAFTPYGSMIGGANRSFMMVLSGLKNTYGHEIHVILPTKGKLAEELERENIPYTVEYSRTLSGVMSLSPINIYRLLRFHLRAAKDRRTAKMIAERIKDEGYDLIYINDTDNYLGAMVANEAGIPYVWHFRSLVPANMRFIRGADKIYGNASAIITISKDMKLQLEGNKLMPRDRIAMIHNGIPRAEGISLSKQSTEGGFHLVQCGRITPDKGHHDAIRAMAILRDKGYTDLHLHIVGATPGGEKTEYLASLEDEISRLGVSDMISFDGLISDMAAYRANMTGELVCSVCEPFGRVTVEGMRSGLVVIGSNTGGTPEIINDGVTGLLYQQGSHTDLADKIEWVYNNADQRLALASRAVEFSNTHFTAEGNVEAVNGVIVKAKEEFYKANGIG